MPCCRFTVGNAVPLESESAVLSLFRICESESESVVVWTNEYGPKKARVFATTIGHNNATVDDPRYLDLIARGVLWAAGKLGDDGKPLAGYGPVAK